MQRKKRRRRRETMAAEALDIKTLTTLIMATPKTDIEQSVGRILRERHGKPVVVDIVDSHEVFQRQWAKRKTFYKKQGYSIWRTSSPEYQPDTSRWRQVFRAGGQDGACSSSSSVDKSSVDKSLPGRCLLPLKKPVHNNLDTSAI
jgi:superfamily II DNA or RNA helicase